MKDYMRATGVKDGFSNLIINMWANPQSHATAYPKLKGKAKEIKEFAGVLSWYWAKTMEPEDLREKELFLSYPTITLRTLNLTQQHQR